MGGVISGPMIMRSVNQASCTHVGCLAIAIVWSCQGLSSSVSIVAFMSKDKKDNPSDAGPSGEPSPELLAAIQAAVQSAVQAEVAKALPKDPTSPPPPVSGNL